jgi:hypothetical protein
MGFFVLPARQPKGGEFSYGRRTESISPGSREPFRPRRSYGVQTLFFPITEATCHEGIAGFVLPDHCVAGSAQR